MSFPILINSPALSAKPQPEFNDCPRARHDRWAPAVPSCYPGRNDARWTTGNDAKGDLARLVCNAPRGKPFLSPKTRSKSAGSRLAALSHSLVEALLQHPRLQENERATGFFDQPFFGHGQKLARYLLAPATYPRGENVVERWRCHRTFIWPGKARGRQHGQVSALPPAPSKNGKECSQGTD
jgi:hypothetical protein